jgi:hypothetical protein
MAKSAVAEVTVAEVAVPEAPITKAPAPKGRKRAHAQAAEEPAEQPANTKKGKNLFLTIQINSMY